MLLLNMLSMETDNELIIDHILFKYNPLNSGCHKNFDLFKHMLNNEDIHQNYIEYVYRMNISVALEHKTSHRYICSNTHCTGQNYKFFLYAKYH